MLSAMSSKLAEKDLIVVDQLSFEQPKTKEMVKVLTNLKAAAKVLIVTDGTNENVMKSASNLPGVQVTRVDQMNVYEIINHTSFILTKDAVAKIEEVYA